MTNLYPLKFVPVLKERVWGGGTLAAEYGKKAKEGSRIGESWELSGVQGDLSYVANGFLEGNSLEEITEVYMGDLVGEEIFEKYGREFPLLIKLIDASEDLSVQVHPGDELAKERHHAYGKTEMWYILEAAENAKIYTGFNRKMNRESFTKSLEQGDITEKLHIEKPSPGDVFYIPSGRIHAIGKGVVLAEIQQTSDITYRVWDWNRKAAGNDERELHTGLAVDAIDYNNYDSYKTKAEPQLNDTVNITDCEYFTTNIIYIDKTIVKDYSLTDSFVIYICIEGRAKLEWDGGAEDISKGETVLIPAIMESIAIVPGQDVKILEVFIKAGKQET